MQKQNIIFNLDDTLIECNKYFHLVNELYAARMKEWFPGVPVETVRAKQIEYDLAVVDKNGLTVDHVPQSFLSAYGYFCKETGRTPSGEEIKELEELGYSVFTMPVEPLPHMYETLEELKEEGHDLYLHTGGEEKNQWRKITQLQLAAYFDNRVFVSRHKDRDALAKIMDRMVFLPAVTWMVGNSLRTDVLPGLEQGINVIYIPASNEWHYNVVDIAVEPKGAFLTLNSLSQVAGAIRNYVLEQERKQGGPHIPGGTEEAWLNAPLD
ncbi:HAD family hydrolase [Paenibacillus sp. YN15]|uniref:HAD family hydrolase n=1 Tax=Paenibacillus sp. YN15 TaxID=1742774 RepID=UPI000DCC681F|nr:HAD family hydrolase [Paenibacillus sp. YN15]RAV00512.1 HAD family hydrolase [Paenibacillus sp. YN15]